MKKDWDIVDLLRHNRHDWLNKLQLIKGNLALNKIERVKEIIEEIVIETQQEAKLSNLNIPLFAGFLMTSNWEPHLFRIEFEVLGDGGELSSHDGMLAGWCEEFFAVLDQAMGLGGENHLTISIEPLSGGGRLFFDFSGTITNIDAIESWIKSRQDNASPVSISSFEVQAGEMTLELKLNQLPKSSDKSSTREIGG